MTRVLPHLKGPRRTSILAISFVVFLLSSICHAESTSTAEWNITADKITRFENPESIIAEGNIVLIKREKIPPSSKIKDNDSGWSELLEEEEEEATEISPDDLPEDQEPEYETRATIKADWIAYDIEKETIRARGNVSIESGDDKLVADEAEVDLTNETGTFGDAVITRKDNDLHLEGKKIEKTGLKTYYIEDGWVITCKIGEDEIPPWSFSSSAATVEQGGYAILKNARFNIRNIPVFYLPYFVVPVKNTRQSGLLFPELTSSSRDGFGINVPFFWDISESTDLTFYPEYFSKRGAMPGIEFRYVQSALNKGKFMSSYLDDKLSDPDETEYYADTGFTHTNNDRYWMRGKVDHEFGDNWISRLDLDIVSDRDYLTEFSSGKTGFNGSQNSYLDTFGRGFENQDDDQRENSFKILKSWRGSSLNIDLLSINDVREEETSPTPLWKLPSIDYAGAHPLDVYNFTFEWDADYVNYWRDEGVGGHRADLFPRLSTPLPFGPYLESRAEVGGRGTFYSVDTFGDGVFAGDDTPNRFLYTFDIDLATTLVRDYNLNSEQYSYLSHSLRPFIEYGYISDDDQTDLPDLDAVDRVEHLSAITYGVDSFFNLFDVDDNNIREYGFLRIEQSFDLRSGTDDKDDFSPITLKLGWHPLENTGITYKSELPFEDDDNTIHGLEGYYHTSRGDIFSLEYRFNDEEDLEQINGYLKARIFPVIQAEFKLEHSISENETNEGILALTYLAQCWSVQLKGEYTPTDERVMVVFNLANIGAPFSMTY